jgi:hypothetical protein
MMGSGGLLLMTERRIEIKELVLTSNNNNLY